MRLSFILQPFITYFLAAVPIFAHPTQVSGPRELVEAANSQNGIALTHLRYTEIQLPQVHVEDIYVNTAHALHKNFAAQLSSWTHSSHFRKNSTFRPVITASFDPFSAVEWLVFNSTTLDLSGQTPFTEVSYNVSVTLIPMFVNKTEDVVIIPEFNNTPITFATTTFSIHVLSRDPSDADLQGWTPYILVILSAIAMVSIICVLATCFWQGLCSPCKRRSSGRVNGNLEETEKPEEKATSKSRSIRQRFTETDWSFLRDVAHRQEIGQVTPYDPLPSSTSLSPKPNIHAIREKRLFRDDGFPILSTSSSDTLGVQYVSITGGIFFAVEINMDGRASDKDHHGQQTDYRAHATPYAPEWIHLCPDRMILWGTPPEHISLTGIFKFDVSVIKNTSGSIVGRLSFNLVAQQGTTASDLSSAIFSGTDKDVWYEHSDGIDTLSILSGSAFAIKYHPRGLKRQPAQQGRYYFNCAQALPPWLAFDSDTLEIKGDTTGYRRRDLRDLLVIDRFTRTVGKLRVILVVNEDRA